MSATTAVVIDLRTPDELEGLSEVELVDLYLRVRALLATRLTRGGPSESLEMLFHRVAEVAEVPEVARPGQRVEATPKSRISPREREVLHFLAQEKSNAEIAATLFISENTVKNHVRNIFAKYEVGSRHGAVLAAIREGTLTVD